MNVFTRSLGLVALVISSAAFAGIQAPVKTVSHVDLDRYMGTWYEVASFPQWFSEGCTASQAEYEKRGRRVRVTNSCRLDDIHGPWKSADGWAKVVDKRSNAKLKVTFFWPFFGDYWIIELDEDYRWAVVGSPDRDSLWILSRTRQLDADTLDLILNRIDLQGFDLGRLEWTAQPEEN